MAAESTTAAISNTVFSDPFHLHPSDHPGASLVTKLLNGDNYGTWSRSISIALSAKNKTGFVDGSIPKPLGTDAKFADWKRCNDMVLSWILNSIDPSISDSVIYTERFCSLDRFEGTILTKQCTKNLPIAEGNSFPPTKYSISHTLLLQTQGPLGRIELLQRTHNMLVWSKLQNCRKRPSQQGNAISNGLK